MAEPGDGPQPPLPPADPSVLRPLVTVLPAGTALARIHQPRHDPLFFGPPPGSPPLARFDAPDGAFRTLYAGLSPEAAFAESIVRRLAGGGLVAWAGPAARALARLAVTAELRLVRLEGPGLARIGATAAVASGPYRIARAWAAALHAHPDRPAGLLYRARHDDAAFCVALFDRAAAHLAVTGSLPLVADRRRLGALLDRYGLGLDPER